MINRKIIDFHNHAFPKDIAQKAIQQLEAAYLLDISNGGEYKDLIESAEACNIYKMVVLSAAVNPMQVRPINDWIASIDNDKIIKFGAIHPDYENYKEEFSRIKSLGFKGIKLHPMFQNFVLDDKKLWPFYSDIDRDLIILVHMGDYNTDASAPKRLANVIDAFPHLKIVAAHFGGFDRWDEVEKYLVGKNLYFDTSSSLILLSPEQAVRIIRNHGADKFVYGTDFPVSSHKEELERFLSLPLTDEERDMILYKNAAKLLNL
ncbi:MAG TPA: amidohydrolase [Clostridiales bacterium]|nr:amidohydrolase [Clostridiales bacterium]